MGLFDWFSRKKPSECTLPLTQGAKDFLAGRKDTLTSADIDPEGAAKYASYEQAMALKKAGDLSSTANLLLKSCVPPSIYKGHYEELFKIWRQFNRDDLQADNYQPIVDRVLTMMRFDDEMIQEMIRYWGIQQGRTLPQNYFDRDRNLRVTDAKALLKAAKELGQQELAGIATGLVDRFSKAKKA